MISGEEHYRGGSVKRGVAVLGVVIALMVCISVTGACAVAMQSTPEAAWGVALAPLVAGVLLFGAFRLGLLGRLSVLLILAVAVGLRLLVIPLGPALSDDAYRYLWDGRLVAQGENPYLVAPEDLSASTRGHIDPDGVLYERMNSRSYFSVYPPPSQAVFGLASLLQIRDVERAFLLYKLILIVLECTGLVMLVRWVGPGLAALYAWHPLPVVEIAGQGHTEALFVSVALMGLALLADRRVGLGAAALTVAAWAKLIPLAALPFLVLKRGMNVLGVMLGVTLLLWLPFAQPVAFENIAASLRLYVQLFEFNAGPYFLIKEAARWATGEDYSKLIGPVLSLLFLVGLAVLFMQQARTPSHQRLPISTVLLLVLGGFLLCTTTVHPWYVLMPLAVVPAVLKEGGVASRAWAWGWWWMGLVVFGTYGFYVGEQALAIVSGVLGWSAVAVATGIALFHRLRTSALLQVGLDRVLRARGRSKWRWVSSALANRASEPSRVLDLGAGEGWVGWAAASDGAHVTLADVVDLNQTALPHVRYDGESLPFGADTFDLVLIVFVLHHAESPDGVVREARRVLNHRGRLVVIESVYTNRFNRALLRFLDTRANRLRGEGEIGDQEAHLSFDTADGWRQRFREAGFEVVSEQRKGRVVHRQHLFVLKLRHLG